jgi:hypothetical protein
MSERAIQNFIATIALHFPRPKFNDDDTMETAWLASMNRVLSRYSDDVLADAAVRMLAKRNPKKDGRFFPVPSECQEICQEAEEVKRLAQAPLQLSTAQRDPSQFAGWRSQLADDLVKSEMGRQAKREGWHGALHDFIRSQGRLPSGEEISRCKGVARGFDEALEMARRGEAGEMSHALAVLGTKILKRRSEIAEAIP